MGKEQSLMNKMIDYLHMKGFRAWRMNAGLIKTPQGRYIRLLPRGFSDIMAIDMVGMCYFIEVKTPTGRPTNDQLVFLNDIRSIGCKGGIATSIEELEDIINGGVGNEKMFGMKFKSSYIDWDSL